eukprot:1179951-Prorocentrum_minimum.AAC.4
MRNAGGGGNLGAGGDGGGGGLGEGMAGSGGKGGGRGGGGAGAGAAHTTTRCVISNASARHNVGLQAIIGLGRERTQAQFFATMGLPNICPTVPSLPWAKSRPE